MLTKKDLLEAIADMPMDAKVECYHYKQGYRNAVNKACELLKAVGVLTDDDSIMGFIKAMEE